MRKLRFDNCKILMVLQDVVRPVSYSTPGAWFQDPKGETPRRKGVQIVYKLFMS